MPENEPPQKVIVLEDAGGNGGGNGGNNDGDNNNKLGKKKRYSSKTSRRLGDIENRATKSLNRVAEAVDHGVDEYTKKRNKSEKKRKDGALVDFFVNAATGASTTISESAPVLIDVAEAFTTNRRRKQVRKFVRSFPFRF